MKTKKVPSVRIWRVSDPRTCNIADDLTARKAKWTPRIKQEIDLGVDPFMSKERREYRTFQDQITTQVAHLAMGGGALIWIQSASNRFYRAGFLGVGGSVDLAAMNCTSSTFAANAPDNDATRFFWVQKAGETKFVGVKKRRVTCFSGKLWFSVGEKDEDNFHQTPNTGTGLRG